MLLLIEINIIALKKGYKKNLVRTFSFSSSKIVFMLLTKL